MLMAPLCPDFLFENRSFYKGVRFPLTPSPFLRTPFMDGPITVVYTGHKLGIISEKDLPKVIEWACFENWKRIKHNIRQNSGRDPVYMQFQAF